MIQLDRQNKSPGVQNEGTMLSYSPFEVYRCCQHNVSHGWPYYAEELWLATADGGLCASLYAASELEAKVGDGTVAKIAEETDYPFGDTVRLRVSLPKAVRFPLYLRIPRWSGTPVLTLNSRRIDAKAEPLSYLVVEREWSDGDTLSLQLPMRTVVRTWKKNHDAVSVDYGPLTFSLRIGERWQRYGGTDAWPEWEVFPTTPWNYGLVLDKRDPAASFKLERRSGPLARQPFTAKTSPLWLKAKAKRIPAWQPDRLGLIGPLQQSPVKSDKSVERVTLIPMGAARLRVAAFPRSATVPTPTRGRSRENDELLKKITGSKRLPEGYGETAHIPGTVSTTALRWQSKMGTGSVASVKLRSARQCPWRRCLSPFSTGLGGNGGHACGKRGRAPWRQRLLLVLPRLTPRSQSPFSAKLAQSC